MPPFFLRMLRITNYTTALVLTLSATGTPVFAANSEEPKWYQVEIILFTREQNNLPATEQWRVDFNPLYPENTVILSPYDKLIEIPAESVAPTSSPTLPVLDAALEKSNLEAAKPIDIEKDPYIILPSDKQQLSKEASQLRRTSGFKILEHLAWRQPVSSRESSQPILIQTGNQYGLYFEVEGLITISENRYLHVDTDLVFSKFTKELINNYIDWSLLNDSTLTGTEKAAPSTDFSFKINEPKKVEDSLAFQLPEQQYRREFATSLKHIRRVRNDELHYFDHPLFGLIVKLTPHQLPDPAMDLIELDLLSLPQLKTMPEAAL